MRCSDSICRFGSMAISERIEKLSVHMENARDMKDPEDVHQLRVTSRRLRAAIPVFKCCFHKKSYKRYIKGMKRVTRSLGNARDLDVQIIYLESLLKEHRRRLMGRALRYLIDRRKKERIALQKDVVRSLDDLGSSRLLGLITEDCGGMMEGDMNAPWPPGLYHIFRDNMIEPLEVLSELSPSLSDEGKREEHHEMRIAAKRLRYTLDLFSVLFEDGLSKEISFLKKLQDVLGEIHDCDVWSMQIPRLMDDAAGSHDIEKGLELFREHIEKNRSELFSKAGGLWSSNSDILSSLKSISGSEAYLPASRFPKLAFISDIHGNHHALLSVLDDARSRGVSIFINAGDSVGYGALPGEVLDEISGEDFLNICGNFDLEMLDRGKGGKKGAAEKEKMRSLKHTRRSLHDPHLKMMAEMPRERKLLIGWKKVHVVHASPLSKKEQVTPNIPETRLAELLTSAGADMLVLGHSHKQFLRDCIGGRVLNPGSVGRPDDGDPRAAYAIMDTSTGDIDLLRVRYDVDAAVEAIRREGLPEHFAQMLIRGRALEEVIDEEKILDSLERADEDLRAVREKVKAIGTAIDPDPGHTDKVTTLSLSLFDQLEGIHMLGREERHLLECSALLHDIGWSRSGGKHHVSSMKMILNDTDLPLGTRERYMVASIARYHNSLPKTRHYNYSILRQIDRRTVSMLSSILRIADALDASHGARVSKADVLISEERVEIRAAAAGPIEEEVQKFAMKRDLFERVFKRSIVLSA